MTADLGSVSEPVTADLGSVSEPVPADLGSVNEPRGWPFGKGLSGWSLAELELFLNASEIATENIHQSG